MKKIIFVSIYILVIMQLVGCWNYREIDEVEIVLGFAVDSSIREENIENRLNEKMDPIVYSITYELVGVKSKEGELESRVLSNKGDTVFEAMRKLIQKNGKKLYLAHTKILVIGEEHAKEGITEILDYTMRDVEYRPDVHILISNGTKAEKIFTSMPSEVISLKLNDALYNQDKIGNFEIATVWNIIDKLSKKGFEPSIPLINLEESEDGKVNPNIGGMAVFKGTKMVGKLSESETLYYLFIDNEIKNQPLSIEYYFDNELGHISLEFLKNKTKVTPIIDNNNIVMNINIKCDVAISELSNKLEILDEEEIDKLERYIEKYIEKGINNLLIRVQKEFNSDIFGFGDLIKRDRNKIWKEIEDDWDEIFATLPIITDIEVHIKKTALSSQSIETDKY
jgi:spore germination protein KC